MSRTSAWREISLIFLVTGLVGAQQEIIFSESTVFQLFIQEGDFNTAKQRCESLTQPNSNFEFGLARVDSREQFDFIAEGFNFADLLLTNTTVDNLQRQGIWMGIERTRDVVGDTISTDDFSFVDGVETNRSFFEAPNDFPWDPSQPNNRNGQNCVSWELLPLIGAFGPNTPIRWYDDDCGATMSAFLCRGEQSKTPNPTQNPSDPPVTTSSNDNVLTTVFLLVAAIAAIMVVVLVFLIVREKLTS